jgi:hypothetical protein
LHQNLRGLRITFSKSIRISGRFDARQAHLLLSDRRTGGDVFIVDNSDADWKVRRYLHDWADLAHAIDIATGYFETGGLLALDGQWQKIDKFHVLMGDEVSLRTGKAFTEALKTAEVTLDESIEREKETNDFLAGVPAVVDAIGSSKIDCRIYT